ncbi:MAG: hypothetical protein H3C46_03035 [Ignavibacteria bacterium]|nr:hypothetical protein [Ignavibacteria bacterium]
MDEMNKNSGKKNDDFFCRSSNMMKMRRELFPLLDFPLLDLLFLGKTKKNF